jgi:uncharacterized membrane protein (DUF373 family)
MTDSDLQDDPLPRIIDRALVVGERIVYIGLGLLLFCCALAALVAVAYGLIDHSDDGTLDAVADALDGLLLVFILVELLGGVRATLVQRSLVAEPFLIVGIIASIKEIIVASLALADASGPEFDEGIQKVGVLGVVVLLLSVSTFLVRRKEREPDET